ncbi:MAG: deoxynucleoside kinase [Bacteroidia bacterium]|nr:deoxynucleoside kinase [Bacteroidia bacterium]
MNYICIEGNIGSGKTSLAKKLAAHYNAEFLGEEFEENPFLPLFYKEPEKFAFSLEFSFLLDRARQLISKKAELTNKLHFCDYFIEKCLYFAQINLPNAQFEEFKNAFPSIESIVPKPDLLIFLHLNEKDLVRNIELRGRPFEKNISTDYLSKINHLYLKNSAIDRSFRVLDIKIRNSDKETYQKVFEEVKSYIKYPPQAKYLELNLG